MCNPDIIFIHILYHKLRGFLLRNTGLWWVQMSAVAATLLERPVLDHQLQLTLAELAVKVWCHLPWHHLVYILYLATVYESKFSQISRQVLTFWVQIQINFSFKSRSASCAQLSRRGSNFVSSASKCFPWELPKLTHYAKRQKSICKHHQASLSQTNILSSYRDQPKNSSCCFGLKGVFCCILESSIFLIFIHIYPLAVQMSHQFFSRMIEEFKILAVSTHWNANSSPGQTPMASMRSTSLVSSSTWQPGYGN